jgi:exosortase
MSAWLTRLGALALAILVVADVARDLRESWTNSPYASHGPLAGLFAAYAAWRLRTALPPERWRPRLAAALAGMVTVIVLVAGHALGALSLRAAALPLTVLTIILLAYGCPGVRVLAFPLVFLVAVVPLPAGWLAMLSSASQHAAAGAAHRALDLCGIPVVREGLTLHIGRVDLAVTEACNGLRFLFASALVGLAIAWALSRRRPTERALVVALALMAGVAANLVRVTGTALLAWVEPTAVMGTPHLVFGKAVYLAVGIAVALAGATLLRRSIRAA